MMDKLTAKIGPLPAYMWGLILGGLLLAYMWWSRRKSAAAGAAQVVTTTGTPFDVPSTGGLSPAGGVSTGTDTTGTSGSSPWGTNALWEASALAALSGSGVSPLAAQIALEKYLNGVSLSTADQQIVNLALSKQGAPPNGLTGPPVLDPVPSTSGGGTTTTPPPAHGSSYVVRPGDNWITIAQKYGVSEAALLAVNNDSPVRGAALGVGEAIWLPSGAVASATPAPTPKPAPPKSRIVTINRGDNWNTIAARLGVTEPALRGANPQLPGTLSPGNFTFRIP